MERRLHAALFNNTQNDVRLRINLSRGLQGPPLPLRIEHADMVFVLKVKIELALRLLRETGHGTSGPLPKAEDIELEFRGVPLRDMMAIDRYGIDSGAELVASYVPQPPERNLVPHEPGFVNLEELIMAEAGVPSTGAIKRIINRTGKMCCVCWRSRWFRATVLEIYSTSLLLKWHDWPDAEWPNFFVKVALAAAPNTPPAPHDETWRIRWHHTTPVRELPVVQPKFSELPPLNWVKAFLRTYASRDEMGLLREVQSQLPREMVEAKQASFARHRCLVIGASNVGKSTLIQTICDGPPPNERAGGLAGAMPLLGGRTARTSRTSRTSRTTNRATGRMGSGGGESGYDLGMDSVENAHVKQPYWPTVGTTLYKASVSAPGLPALPLELFDTSGNPRFKPLSLVFYRQAREMARDGARLLLMASDGFWWLLMASDSFWLLPLVFFNRQAQSVVLVFDVKSMRSFRALGEVGGWLHEFTRLTGLSPHNFPFVLVGNKSEDDVMHPRQGVCRGPEPHTSGFGCCPAALLPAFLPLTERSGARDSPPQSSSSRLMLPCCLLSYHSPRAIETRLDSLRGGCEGVALHAGRPHAVHRDVVWR